VDAWKASGKSQKAFCRANQLNYPQFGYWVRKFFTQSNKETAPSRSGFAAVTPSTPQAATGLSVVLPNGLEVRGICTNNIACVHQLLRDLS
jgi:uncharacterized membrane protein